MIDQDQNGIPDKHEAYIIYGSGIAILLFSMLAFWFKNLDSNTLIFLIVSGSSLIGGKSYLKSKLTQTALKRGD